MQGGQYGGVTAKLELRLHDRAGTGYHSQQRMRRVRIASAVRGQCYCGLLCQQDLEY